MKCLYSSSLFLCLFLMGWSSTSFAQDDPIFKKGKFGITDAAMIDRLMPLVPGVGIMTNASASGLDEQNVKPYMMPVRQIQQFGNPETYLLASCLEYYVNLKKNYKVNLSPDYISLNLQSQGKAVNFKDAFRSMGEVGTVSAAIVPYGQSTISPAVYSAQKFKILNYLHIIRDVTKTRQRIFEIRKALLRGNPVIVEVKTDAAIETAYGKNNLQLNPRGQQVYPIIVVGFDETKEAFEVMGPWGSNWGKGGYLWISYDEISKQTQNGYVLVPDVKM